MVLLLAGFLGACAEGIDPESNLWPPIPDAAVFLPRPEAGPATPRPDLALSPDPDPPDPDPPDPDPPDPDPPDEPRQDGTPSPARPKTIGLYAVDGSGADESSGTMIHAMYSHYPGPKEYWPGPNYWATNTLSIRDAVERRACDDYTAGKITHAAFIGYSRGAVIAVNAARRAHAAASCQRAGKPLPVVYIGLLDAVDTLIWAMKKTPPPNAPTFHRIKASKWQHVYTTCTIPNAVVSQAAPSYPDGTPIDHTTIWYDEASHRWLADQAASCGVQLQGPLP